MKGWPAGIFSACLASKKASYPLLFPYEPKVEANQKEHEVDDAPQSQQFWGNGKPKKRNSQVSKIEIRVYPSANKKRAGEKFTDLFPINAHNSKRPIQ